MAEKTLEKELEALRADLENLREGVSARGEKVVKEFTSDIASNIKKHPVKCVLIGTGVAFLMGLVIAKIARRSKE